MRYFEGRSTVNAPLPTCFPHSEPASGFLVPYLGHSWMRKFMKIPGIARYFRGISNCRQLFTRLNNDVDGQKKIIVRQYSDWRYMKQKETNLKLKISNKVTSSNCLLKCLNDIYTRGRFNWFAVHSIMLTQITNCRIRNIFHILSSYSFSSSVQNVLFSI